MSKSVRDGQGSLPPGFDKTAMPTLDMTEWMRWSATLPNIGRNEVSRDFWRDVDAMQAVLNED